MQPGDLTLGAPGYLATPSPGSINGATYGGPVADTKFSIDRGFFDAAFDLAITSATAGAEIRYTLDGTTPSPTQGLIYTTPIPINSTTVVRAMAHLSGSGLKGRKNATPSIFGILADFQPAPLFGANNPGLQPDRSCGPPGFPTWALLFRPFRPGRSMA